jgi:hypothetical protein
VRAILLEMQRRKVNFGADGVRVDGAQDFKWWDAAAQELRHDDDYLQSMADVEQEVAGTTYRPWFIFEDGRPWPEEDWELSSTYRAVIESQRDDDVFQWGPLTFAHNTPFLYTFWLSKFWRIREMVDVGRTGFPAPPTTTRCAAGTQVSPKLNINTRLGRTRMEILDKAYDNPAVHVLTYVALPGVPMDFLNAMARASWGFIRNQDDRYGVKVVAEEAISLKWQVDEYSYSVPGNFRRLKEMGFETREELARFFEIPAGAGRGDRIRSDEIARLLNASSRRLPGRSIHAGPSRTSPAPGWTTCTTTATSRIRSRRSMRIRLRSACMCAISGGPVRGCAGTTARRIGSTTSSRSRANGLYLAAPWAGWRTGVHGGPHGRQAHG